MKGNNITKNNNKLYYRPESSTKVKKMTFAYIKQKIDDWRKTDVCIAHVLL